MAMGGVRLGASSVGLSMTGRGTVGTGVWVGDMEGSLVGTGVGEVVGLGVGSAVGAGIGGRVLGAAVGLIVGFGVGANVVGKGVVGGAVVGSPVGKTNNSEGTQSASKSFPQTQVAAAPAVLIKSKKEPTRPQARSPVMVGTVQ